MHQLTRKILYGSVEIGLNAVETFVRLHLLVFYSRNLGLPTSWAAAAIAISILWDAALDPWVGRVSDYFKAQKGTRIHLVLAGAIGTALTLTALYHPPSLEPVQQKWLYLLLLSIAFHTSLTFFSIPYAAMVGDYSKDRDERSQFIAWRWAFANVGAMIGIGVPGYYLIRSVNTAYANASWVLAMVVMFFALVGSMGPPLIEKVKIADPLPSEKHPILQAFANRPFLFILASFFVVNIGLTINSTLALYFFRVRLRLAENEVQNILLLFLVIFSMSVPFWIWVSRKFGRKVTLLAGAVLLAIVNSVMYYSIAPGNATQAYIIVAGLGGFLAGSSVLLESILTDVVDFDHLKSGVERWGLYFGIWKFSAKFARALSMFFAGTLLDWANVNFPDVDTESRLVFAFGPAVGFFFFLAALFLLPFPLTEKKCLEIREGLEKKSHG